MTSASPTFTKYWYQAYGEVSAGSSQMFPPPVDLPNLRPSASVTSGAVIAWAAPPSTCRMRSTPPMMLPHWSEPPTCSVQPYLR